MHGHWSLTSQAGITWRHIMRGHWSLTNDYIPGPKFCDINDEKVQNQETSSSPAYNMLSFEPGKKQVIWKL